VIRKFYYILLSLLFPLILLFLFPLSVRAEVIFEDNFDLYLNGSFPSRWVEVLENCPIDWVVQNGEAYSRITNRGSCLSNIMPNDSVWPTPISDYIFEADVRFGVGVDHNLVYRMLPSVGQLYELHFQIPGGFEFTYPRGGELVYSSVERYQAGRQYHIKVVVDGLNLKAYIDDKLVREAQLSVYMPAGKVALRIGTGANPNSETWFDNVRVTTLDHVDGVSLPVPALKQTSSPWNDDLYDTANLWAVGGTDMATWGCAVTSAAMVFQFYGLDTMLGGVQLDPGSMNTWLRSQPDGYVRGGLVNWLALSRLSKQIANRNAVSFDALEYSRINSSNHQYVKDGIDGNIPSILSVPGHFVVGKGYVDDDILINDPYYDRGSLALYANSFQNISQFAPSNTDLSYIMLVVDENVDIKMFDGDGNEVGDLVIEEPISDPVGEAVSNAKPLKIVYLSKPSSGEYRIEISASEKTSYNLDTYFYDEGGNVNQFSFNEKVNKETDIYYIDFSKNTSSDSYVLETVAYPTLIKNIKVLYKDKELKLGAYIEISTKAKLAQRAQKNNTLEKRYLHDLKNSVKSLTRNKEVSNSAHEYLIRRINFLLKNI